MARRPIPMIELDALFYRWQQGHTISRLCFELCAKAKAGFFRKVVMV